MRLARRRRSLAAVAAQVRMKSLAAVPNLDCRRRGTDLDALADERMRRAVERRVEGHVLVDVEAREGVLPRHESLRGKQPQRRPIELLVRRVPAAGQLLEG